MPNAAKYLLDTNIFSEAMRQEPQPQVIEKLDANFSEVATASVVIHELLFGAYRLVPSVRRTIIEDYAEDILASDILVLPYGSVAAKWHASERARLGRFGRTPPYNDAQIAAIAATNSLVLVTRNTKDFQYFQGLTVENWFE